MNSTPTPIGVVAHYNLLERLDPAGPGELYRARDTRLGRTVAVRLLPPDFAAHPPARAALLDKARALAGRSHANVTTMFEAGEHEGRLFVVFEFVTGRSLRADMGARPMNVRRAVELAIQMADAVADAHAAGFLLGGVSPESILITAKGHVKIAVFELAGRSGFAERADGVRLHDYEAPEEARGERADERADVYSVGAVLYEMLTTRRPMHRGAAAPSAANRHVPPELDAAVLKAIAPNASTRIQSAAVLAAELRSMAALLDARGAAAEAEEAVRARSISLSQVLLVTAAIVVTVAVLVWWFGGM